MMIAIGILREFSKSPRIALGPFALYLLTFLFTPMAHGGGVVNICDEAHLQGAAAGGGSVTFTCSGAITLSTDILIDSETTIDATGQSVTLNGTNSGNIIFIEDPANIGSFSVSLVSLTFQRSTLSAVRDTSGVVLHVDNCTFSGNDSGGDFFGGAIYIENVNSAVPTTVYVRNSSFVGNKASAGGGAIYNAGGNSLLVSDSTFFVNGSTDTGSNGGAILNNLGYLWVTNSTFDDNFAFQGQGGNIYNSGGGFIQNVTMTGGSAAPGQGGNIWVGSLNKPSTLLINTIIANPVPASAGNCSGNVGDGGGNLQFGSSLLCVGAVGDPKLSSLAYNYGPTQTMALLPGSTAIDAVLNPFSCLAADQRGVLRPQGPRCDIGAFEYIVSNNAVLKGLGQALKDFLPALPKNGAGKLTEQVIDPLSRSLNPAFWQGSDGNHLNPQLGAQVFDLHRTVVDNLSELVVDQTQLDYIDNLLFADRTLAVVAMGDGGCVITPTPAAPPSAKCAEAVKDLLNGDGRAAAGDYGAAIDSYKAAWGDGSST